MATVLEKLLDFNQPLDVQLLDEVVMAMYTCRDDAQRKQINAFMIAFQEHPEAWKRVDKILEVTNCDQSKFFALATLEACVKQRWKVLPLDEREALKSYIVNVIVRYSSDEASLQQTKLFLGKLNLILVHILKHEWPHNWKDFIPQIVESGKTNEALCGNNMQILRLLSEEVFEFSLKQLTSRKIHHLKERLTEEFALIYQLCEFVMQHASNAGTLTTTLQCFLRFLFWMPQYYIFETQLLDLLLHKFFPHPHFRIDALQCLTEIAAIESKSVDPKYHPRIQKMFFDVMTHLGTIVHFEGIERYYHEAELGQELVHRLALFLTTIFKTHLGIVEQEALAPALIQGMQVFKMCVEFWHDFADDLYHYEHLHLQQALSLPAGVTFSLKQEPLQCRYNSGAGIVTVGAPPPSPRLVTYSPILMQVRRMLIGRMSRPEEVLIVEDENGRVVKEQLKDVEVVALHKMMREALVFLTHLQHQQTEEMMIEMLAEQVTPVGGRPGWSRQTLSSLCWAIGSISGAMREDDEKKFVVHVIKELLGLVEHVRGKDNKAVIASNIMYVVGQYPRFLRAHWKFLKTVVNKLFEFMRETHPGVQDMACETFLNICQRCKHQFVKQHAQEASSFIEQLLRGPHDAVPYIGTTIEDLEASQQNMFYEAVGHIVSAESEATRCAALVGEVFKLPNSRWQALIDRAILDAAFLMQHQTMREIARVLQINERVATSLGTPYMHQLSCIYERMLQVYKLYSEQISAVVGENGLNAKTANVRLMRAVKRDTLRLIQTTVDKSQDVSGLVASVLPPMLDYILSDYASNHPDTRDPEVLSVLAAFVRKAGGAMMPHIPRILEAVFDTTLAMITANMLDFPEHRLNFYLLLKEMNNSCFRAFFDLPRQVWQVLVDAIVWAFKHSERNIADTGLTILLELLRNLDVHLLPPSPTHPLAEFAAHFYSHFLLNLIHEIFSVLTDKEHEPGFKLQCEILHHLLSRVELGLPGGAMLFNPAQHPGVPDNRHFLRVHLTSLLTQGFSERMTAAQVRDFVAALFDPTKDKAAFQTLLRDFLVTLGEYNCDEWTESSLAIQLDAQQRDLQRQQAEAGKWEAVPGLMPVTKREELDTRISLGATPFDLDEL